MTLQELFINNRSLVIKKWWDLIVDTYPGDTRQFLRRQKDPFANPIGASVREGLEDLVDGIVRGADTAELSKALSRIVRIRALQKFAPSSALAFVFQLKNILRDLEPSKSGGAQESKRRDIEDEIDGLALLAFDVYADCIKELGDIRIKEERRQVHLLLKRANLLAVQTEEEIDLPDLRNGGPVTNNEAR